MGKSFVTPPGITCFPSLFKPGAAVEGAEPKYAVTILLNKDDAKVQAWIPTLATAISEAITATWPDEASRPKNLLKCIKDGDTFTDRDGNLKKASYPEFANCYALDARTKKRPKIVGPNGLELLDESEIYSGIIGAAAFHLYSFDNVTKGVNAGLECFMKVADGDPLGGGGSINPQDAFADLIAANAGATQRAAAKVGAELFQ